MKTRTNASKLGDAISDILKEYSDEVVKAMPEACLTAAKATVKALKEHAGKIGGSGAYRKSFKYKKTESSSSGTTYTVYSTKYRIAHLLERGHAVRNRAGGRVYGITSAYPHWAPAEEEGIEVLEEELRKAAEQ